MDETIDYAKVMRVTRAIRGMHATTSSKDRPYPGIPEEHTSDCVQGGASIEVVGPLGAGLYEVSAVCGDCGAYLDRLYLGGYGSP